MTHHKCYVETT